MVVVMSEALKKITDKNREDGKLGRKADILTQKEIHFCQLIVEKYTNTDAYFEAFDATCKRNVACVKANELMKKEKIIKEIARLREEHAKRHRQTVDDLLLELEDARLAGMKSDKPNVAVQATMGKAKLLGLDKQLVEHSGEIKNTAPTINIKLNK